MRIFTILQPLSIYFVRRTRLIERFPLQVAMVQQKMIAYHGIDCALNRTKEFIEKIVALDLLVLIIFLLLGVVVDPLLLYCGMAVILLIPIAYYRDLNHKVMLKKRLILLDLPEFLNKLTLLVDAGEHVQKAICRCVEHKSSQLSFLPLSPLYQELHDMALNLNNNQSFQHVLENFNKRCNIQEISILTTTILLNYRRGGVEFVYALRELNKTVWDKRMLLAKTLGEEASSKLVIPMVMIFIIVMVIVAAPAILIMNAN